MSYTEWQMFDSSSIAAGRYDPDSKVLEIQFNEGKIYKYVDVPRDIWLSLCRADSKGLYFQSQIREKFSQDHKNTASKNNVPTEKSLEIKLQILDLEKSAIAALINEDFLRAYEIYGQLELLVAAEFESDTAKAFCMLNRAACLFFSNTDDKKALDLSSDASDFIESKIWGVRDSDSDIGDKMCEGECLNNCYNNEIVMNNFGLDWEGGSSPRLYIGEITTTKSELLKLKYPHIDFVSKIYKGKFRQGLNAHIQRKDQSSNNEIKNRKTLSEKETIAKPLSRIDYLERGIMINWCDSYKAELPSNTSQTTSPRKSGCASVIVIGIATVASLYFI